MWNEHKLNAMLPLLLLLLLQLFTDVDEMHQHRLQVAEAGSRLHAETQLLLKVTAKGNLRGRNQKTCFLLLLLEGVVYTSALHSVVQKTSYLVIMRSGWCNVLLYLHSVVGWGGDKRGIGWVGAKRRSWGRGVLTTRMNPLMSRAEDLFSSSRVRALPSREKVISETPTSSGRDQQPLQQH